MDGETSLVHATCIAVGDRAALIVGPSGSGKSDLALRAMSSPVYDGDRRLIAELVSDDQVLVEAREGRLIARAPPTIAGRMEVRGIGIVPVEHLAACALCLAVEIDTHAQIERLPQENTGLTLLGVRLPSIRLQPFEASAHIKLILALARADWHPAGQAE